MRFTVLTLFPEIIEAYAASSIMARAVERGLVECRAVNIRDYAVDRHHTCDDAPYGGGAGMLMLPEPLARALEAVGAASAHVIYLSPSGSLFDQAAARRLAGCDDIVLICGRYEGIDQRVIDLYVDEELSVGDYVLSSGEVAALAVIDAAYRLLPGVISGESLSEESFTGGLLEYPQFTRPEVFATLAVPEVLLSGHHENIRKWRLQKRVEKTARVRPELLERGLRAGLFDDETRKLIGGVYERDQGD